MGQLVRQTYEDREAWLLGRASGIGASDAAAIIGESPWLTSMQLWRQKIGADKPKDLSRNSAVEQGNRLEPVLRTLFAALHPDTAVGYSQFDILSQSDRPWLCATLDGELTENDGRKGVLEIKTSTPGSAAGWSKWQNAVPKNYYAQILHQLLATDWDFVVLFACLFGLDGDATLRTYRFEREECREDMDWLLKEETRFWGYVESGTMPPMILKL